MRLCDVPGDLVARIAREALGCYREFLDRHDGDEVAAEVAAVAEVVGAAGVDLDALRAELAAEEAAAPPAAERPQEELPF